MSTMIEIQFLKLFMIKKFSLFVLGLFLSTSVLADSLSLPLWERFKLGITTFSTVNQNLFESPSYRCTLNSSRKFQNNERQLVILGACLNNENLEYAILNFDEEEKLSSWQAQYQFPGDTKKTTEFLHSLLANFGAFKDYQLTKDKITHRLYLQNEKGRAVEIDRTPYSILLTVALSGKEQKQKIDNNTISVATHLLSYKDYQLHQAIIADAFSPDAIVELSRKETSLWPQISKEGLTIKGVLTELTPNYITLNGSSRLYLTNMRALKGAKPYDFIVLRLKGIQVNKKSIYATLESIPNLSSSPFTQERQALELLAQGKRKEALRVDKSVIANYSDAKALEGFLTNGPCFVPFEGGTPFNERSCRKEIDEYFASPQFLRSPVVEYFKRLAQKF